MYDKTASNGIVATGELSYPYFVGKYRNNNLVYNTPSLYNSEGVCFEVFGEHQFILFGEYPGLQIEVYGVVVLARSNGTRFVSIITHASRDSQLFWGRF